MTFSGKPSVPLVGACTCSESGCSAPCTGESTPPPHGADMRQTTVELTFHTSACRHGPAPHATWKAGVDPGDAGTA